MKPHMARNPLIMKEMAKHVPDAGSYARRQRFSWTSGQTEYTLHMTRWSAFWFPTRNAEALSIARDLDSTIRERLLRGSQRRSNHNAVVRAALRYEVNDHQTQSAIVASVFYAFLMNLRDKATHGASISGSRVNVGPDHGDW